MNKYAATNDNGGSRSRTFRRYLQQQETTTTTSNNSNDECNRPEITEKELRTDMTIANNQCSRTSGVSLLEYEYVVTTFHQLFTNVDCWVSLCDGRSNGYFFKSLIANAAQCANVVLVNDCVYDSMLDLVLGGQRRVLAAVASSSSSFQESSTACNDNLPSEAEVTASIEYLLLQSKTHCISVGVNYSSEIWDMVTSDLVTIFTSSDCWEWPSDCEEQDEATTSSFSSEMSATFITKTKTISYSFITAVSISLILLAYYYYYRFRQHHMMSDVLLGQEFVLDDSSEGQMKKNINTTNDGGTDEESSSLQYTTFDDGESLAYSITSMES
jgi:hypothetical protein